MNEEEQPALEQCDRRQEQPSAPEHYDQRLENRSPDEVFRDHLALRKAGEVDRDIDRNYAESVVLCSVYGVFRGRDGIRKCAAMLKKHIGDAKVQYQTTMVCGEIAFLEWTAKSDTVVVEDGVDTFLIRDGQIINKTVHYTPRHVKLG
jgi:hypothetical protein